MGIREEFYDSLRQEYELEGERSFLYRYFLAHPRQRRGGTKEPDVHRSVQTFLYDAQHGRKKDQSLAMLDAYCAQRGIASVLSGAPQADLEELERFCRRMRAGKNTTLLIPLTIDPGTGAGLYLMGRFFLEDMGLHLSGACCYVCLWMEEIILTREDDRYTWSLGSVDRELLEEQCGFPNLTEALRWFRHLTAIDQDAYQSYTVNNGPVPPDCPPALRRYFEQGQEREASCDLILQGRESFFSEHGEP